MNAGSIRWGVSYSALLWASAVLMAPETAVAAPTEIVLHSFTAGGDGSAPLGAVSGINRAGVLYGTTSQGGDVTQCGGKGCGVVFELTPPAAGETGWTETVLHQFAGGTDGAAPIAGLLIDKTGALYGTTSEGGGGACHSYKSYDTSNSYVFHHFWKKKLRIGCGTIFKLTPPAAGQSAWTESVLHSLRPAEGRSPSGVPIMDRTGALYGVASEGGKGPCGYFSSSFSMANSQSRLQLPVGCGTVFKLTPPVTGQSVWTLARLHDFRNHLKSGDGAFPVREVTFSPDGSLFGATQNFFDRAFTYYYYDDHDFRFVGSIFKLTPPASGGSVWKELILYDFAGPGSAYPGGGLYQDSARALFGTAQDGGTGAGTVFQISPPSTGEKAWTEAILHNFAGGTDGASPPAGLARDPATGVFYGVTRGGGLAACGGGAGCGTVFSLKPPAGRQQNWTEAVLHRFGRGKDGQSPQARLFLDKAGTLYGTTESGGAYGHGTVFMIPP